MSKIWWAVSDNSCTLLFVCRVACGQSHFYNCGATVDFHSPRCDCYDVFGPVLQLCSRCSSAEVFGHRCTTYLLFVRGIFCLFRDIHQFIYVLALLSLPVSDCLELPLVRHPDVLLFWIHELPRHFSHEQAVYFCCSPAAAVVCFTLGPDVHLTEYCVSVCRCWCQCPIMCLRILNWLRIVLRRSFYLSMTLQVTYR